MKYYFSTISQIVIKDLKIELRTKETIVPTFVFALISICVFHISLSFGLNSYQKVSIGIWILTILYSSILIMNRSFSREIESESLSAILTSPIHHDALYFGKLSYNVIILGLVQVILSPIFYILFEVNVYSYEMLLIFGLGTIGICSVGTTFSIMTAFNTIRDVLMPLLLIHIQIPIIIAIVESTNILFGFNIGNSSELVNWILLLVSFDAIFLVVSPIAFCIIVKN